MYKCDLYTYKVVINMPFIIHLSSIYQPFIGSLTNDMYSLKSMPVTESITCAVVQW